MTSTATLRWLGLALLGIAVAAAVAIAASNLASQQIGLSSEPISAGDALAPAASPNGGGGPVHSGASHGGGRPAPTARTTTPAAPTTTTTTPAEPPTTPTLEPRPSPQEHDDSRVGATGGGQSDGGGSGGHGADD